MGELHLRLPGRRGGATRTVRRGSSPTCESYWVVDPLEPAITAWWLRDDAYVEVAHVIGADSFAAQHPFAVDVVPAELVAD